MQPRKLKLTPYARTVKVIRIVNMGREWSGGKFAYPSKRSIRRQRGKLRGAWKKTQ